MAHDLTYASEPKWYQKRRFQRRLWWALAIVLAPVVIGAAIAAGMWAYDAWLTYRNRQLLAACTAYVAPPEPVVFEMDRGAVVRSIVAAPWADWWPVSAWSGPTVFLHGRQDVLPPYGPPARLVVVEAFPWLQASYTGRTVLDRPVLCFESSQVRSASETRSSYRTSGSTVVVILPEPDDRIRAFAGQPRQGLDSAFDIEIEYNGQRQQIGGLLSQNQVLLKPASGEVIAPSQWGDVVFWIPAGATPEQVRKTRQVAASSGVIAPQPMPLPAWWMKPTVAQGK